MTDNSYSTTSYGAMMRDRIRIDAYIKALRKVIVPGETTVVELGTGTGVVAFAAAQAGAKKVWAVEPNAAIELAREIAALNNIKSIEFIQAMSTDIELPPADVLLSDMRGITPLYEFHIPSIVDARTRLLRPGGHQISRLDELFAAPVAAEDTWREAVGYWDENPVGVDMSPAKRATASSMTHFAAKPKDLLAVPTKIAELDYRTVTSPDMNVSFQARVTRDGTMHGVSVWFVTHVDDEIRLSGAPGEPLLAYGRPILPLLRPLAVSAGEVLEIDISARFVGDQYHWSWSGGVVGDSNRTFSQHTIDGADVSLQAIKRLRLDRAPQISDDAQRLAFVLQQFDGKRTLAEIIAATSARWPELGSSAATTLVSKVVLRHGLDA